jgi:chromodomain-helicase-DNA-binding protein 1
VKEAKLENKNRVVVIQTCEDIITQAEDAVNAHKAHIRDLQDRGEPITSSLRQKAILFTYLTVTAINAETVIARYYELKALVEHFKRISQLEGYEIPIDNLKSTSNWTVDWGIKEDTHLLIGIWRHGFGSWEQIHHVRLTCFVSVQVLINRTLRYILPTRSSWMIPKQQNPKAVLNPISPARST